VPSCNTVTVTATSVSDSTKSASATITIASAPAIGCSHHTGAVIDAYWRNCQPYRLG
jgi:hypothetical protein